MRATTVAIYLALIILLAACASPNPNAPGYQNKGDFDPIAAAKTRISLGLTYLKNGNYTQAKFNLDKALEFAPRFADAHYSLAYYYQLVDEIDRAKKHYLDALDFAPRNPDIANTYGAFLCQQGEYEEAKTYFLKAVNSQTYVSSAETYENMALCSQTQGKTSDAIDYLQTAINHQPSRSKSIQILAELLASEQRWMEARKNIAKLEKLGRVNADTLLLSAQVEQALGNTRVAKDYGAMLVKMYPEHANSRTYLNELRPQLVSGETPQAHHLAQVKPAQPSTQVQKQATPKLVKKSRADMQPPSDTLETKVSSDKTLETSVIETNMQEGMQEELKSTPDDLSESIADETPIFHVVQKDENLYRISLKYNIKMDRLIEWNDLQDASAIYVGKKLYIVDPASN